MITDPATCSHEAAHAASLCLANPSWPPLFVSADRPTATRSGQVKVDWEHADLTADRMRDLAVSVLCGALDEADIEVLASPLRYDEWAPELQADARTLDTFSQWLEYGPIEWHGLVFDAVQVTRQREYRLLKRAIADQLRETEFLTRDELVTLTETVTNG